MAFFPLSAQNDSSGSAPPVQLENLQSKDSMLIILPKNKVMFALKHQNSRLNTKTHRQSHHTHCCSKKYFYTMYVCTRVPGNGLLVNIWLIEVIVSPNRANVGTLNTPPALTVAGTTLNTPICVGPGPSSEHRGRYHSL